MKAGRDGARWRRLRAQVVAAYDKCGICGQPVDKTLSGNDAMGPTVNHKVPLALGGDPWDWANLELAHRRCNLAGAPSGGLTVPVEPTHSRKW